MSCFSSGSNGVRDVDCIAISGLDNSLFQQASEELRSDESAVDLEQSVRDHDSDLTEHKDNTIKKRKSATPSSDGSPIPSKPAYDPAMLLNPKAAKRPRTEDDDKRQVTDVSAESDGPSGAFGAMIERMHGVKHRDGSGQLGTVKRKVNPDQDEQEQAKDDVKPPAKFNNMRGGGDLAQYVKDKKAEGQNEAVASGFTPSIVDLTADDEDDDLQIVGEEKRTEVCIGRVEGAFVNADAVPTPRGSFQGSSSYWPAINITLRTAMGDHPLNIRARDGKDKRFGRVEARTAGWLAPLLNPRSEMQVRTAARIDTRKRELNEMPGAGTSEVIAIILHLYAKRQDADAIGAYLTKKGIRLRRPTHIEKGREIYNPHEPQSKARAVPGGVGGTSGSAVTSIAQRTLEEIRDEVAGVFDKLTKDEDMPQKEAPDTILTPLLSHQKQALWFMTDREKQREIKSIDDEESNVSLWRRKIGRNGKISYYSVITSHEYPEPPALSKGGILADVMGLGKTLDVLSLIMSSLDESRAFAKKPPPSDLINAQGTLLVCPMSTTANWEEQIRQHIRNDTIKVYVYHGGARTSDAEHLRDYDIVITTFGTLAADYKRTSSKPLHEINWFRVVLDEAHQIRTPNTTQNLAACDLSADRRWAVTGTPVQNRLEDLGALIKFLRVAPIDDKGRFQHFVLTPFKNGDASVVHKLQLLVNSITIRRLKDRINLPTRKDHYVRLDFNDREQKVYQFFAKDGAARVAAATAGHQHKLGGKAYIHVLRSILRLRQICAHGQDLLNDEDHKMMEGMDADKPISIGDNDDDDDDGEQRQQVRMHPHQAYDGYKLSHDSNNDICALCNNKLISTVAREDNSETDSSFEEDTETTIGHMAMCYQIVCPKCFPKHEEEVKQEQGDEKLHDCKLCRTAHRVSFFKLTIEGLRKNDEGRSRLKQDDKLSRLLARYENPSTKVAALLEDLEKNRQETLKLPPGEPPIKSVVFSGWTSNLDLIEIGLRRENITFTRLDGTMSRIKRAATLTAFSTDPTITVILVSISAGGLGLNLTAANKVYVMEPQFNPAAEAQAVDRVHRLGQKRDVDITRFIINDSFEEAMLSLQNKKRNLAKMVTGRKLSREEEIKEKLDELRSLFR